MLSYKQVGEINKLAQVKVSREKTFKSRDSYFKRIIDNLPIQVLVIDEHYRIRYANKAFAKEMGVSVRTIEGKPCYAISHRSDEPCHPPLNVCPLKEVMTKNKTVRTSHVHFDSRGQASVVEITAAPLGGKKNSSRLITEVIRDQTEQHHRDEEIITIAQQLITQDYLFRSRLVSYKELQEAYEPLSKAIAKLMSVAPHAPQIT